MKANVEKEVEATPENMDKFYAELLIMATQAVKERRPVMLMVWNDDSSGFRQQAVAINDKHCAQIVIGFMKQFPLAFTWACKYIIDYTATLTAMKEKEHGKTATH